MRRIRSSFSILHFNDLLRKNKTWAQKTVRQQPHFFSKLLKVQNPQFLWIGCSDSRVPANQILDLKPGEVFVHRNVANIVSPSDINALAVIQYSVQILKVKHIIVTGHYQCGGIKAAFKRCNHGHLEAWLSKVRDLRYRFRQKLQGSQEQQQNQLAQLNVKHQVQNITRIPAVQNAWKEGNQLFIHGLIYRLSDGILINLDTTISSLQQIPQEYKLL